MLVSSVTPRAISIEPFHQKAVITITLAARRSHCCRGLRRLQLLRLLATICPSREQMASPVAIEVGLNSDELCNIRAASLPTPTIEMFLAQCIPQTNVALLVLGESYQASAATAQGCAEPAGPAVLLTH